MKIKMMAAYEEEGSITIRLTPARMAKVMATMTPEKLLATIVLFKQELIYTPDHIAAEMVKSLTRTPPTPKEK